MPFQRELKTFCFDDDGYKSITEYWRNTPGYIIWWPLACRTGESPQLLNYKTRSLEAKFVGYIVLSQERGSAVHFSA